MQTLFPPSPSPYITVAWFGIEQYTSFKHLNIFARRARVNWTAEKTLGVVRAARSITYSVWDMLLAVREQMQLNQSNSFPGTPPYSDPEAYVNAMNMLPFLISGDGNVVKRLCFTDIGVNMCFPDDNQVVAEPSISVKLESFVSQELPEHFSFNGVVVSLLEEDVLRVSEFRLKHCLDKQTHLTSGRKLMDLRVRHHLCGASLPSAPEDVLRDDGFR